jgi:hypothetical protein
MILSPTMWPPWCYAPSGAARLAAEAEAQARTLLIEQPKLTIKKLRHEQFGKSSERGGLLDQLELQLADLEENAAHAETAAGDDRNRQDYGAIVRARQACPPAAAGAFVTGAHCLSGAAMPMLRR